MTENRPGSDIGPVLVADDLEIPARLGTQSDTCLEQKPDKLWWINHNFFSHTSTALGWRVLWWLLGRSTCQTDAYQHNSPEP